MWCAPRKQTIRCQHGLKGQMFGLKLIKFHLDSAQGRCTFCSFTAWKLPLLSLWTTSSVIQKRLNGKQASRFRSVTQNSRAWPPMFTHVLTYVSICVWVCAFPLNINWFRSGSCPCMTISYFQRSTGEKALDGLPDQSMSCGK